MPEFAEGGIVKGGDELPAFITQGCDYIIPTEFAREWAKALLDKLNEGGVE